MEGSAGFSQFLLALCPRPERLRWVQDQTVVTDCPPNLQDDEAGFHTHQQNIQDFEVQPRRDHITTKSVGTQRPSCPARRGQIATVFRAVH